MSELFRRQAIDHQRQKFHGSIVLTRSPWGTAVATFFVLLVLALLVFAATQGFSRKESVAGVLTPEGGVLRLVAPQAGTVAAVPAAQGSRVATGQVIVQLSTEQSSATGPTQEAVARSLASRAGSLSDEMRQQGQQARQQAALLDARVSAAEAELGKHDREISLQRERLELVRDVAARYAELVRSGAVSTVEASEKQAELLDQQSRLSELERSRGATQTELTTLRADRAALPLQTGREESRMRREEQALTQAQAENEVRRGTQVLAPQAGEVATLLAAPGESVTAGQTLATLLPASATIEAELWVPTRAAAFMHAGMPVSLRVDAFPYARYGQLPAHVREVSQSAVAMADLGDPPAEVPGPSRQSVFRVMVALDAGSAPDWRRALKAGMRVQASLVAEHRTLLQWALEPLNALRAESR